ncbi:unnamed protein product [Urochloa humidicola]
MMMEQQAEESCVPPGFRFHPTEEELVGYYLARKVASQEIDLDIIQELHLYRIEPWDLQERCKQCGGQDEQQTEWYFFSYKDRKYPSGTRTNRATAAGFWKATGRDKPVLSSRCRVIGMRKTLVFYKGRAPSGRKTDWIMHEYRLQDNEHAPAQEEGWVVCRAFQKPIPKQQRPFFPSSYAATPAGGYSSAYGYDLQYLQQLQGPAANISSFPPPPLYSDHDLLLSESKKHLFSSSICIPQLESPTATTIAACASQQRTTTTQDIDDLAMTTQGEGQAAAGAIDWSFLDALLSSTSQQLHDQPSTFLQQ